MNNIHLFIGTDHIGGAEKRLLSIWLELVKQKKISPRLLISKALFDHIGKVTELTDILDYEDHINTEVMSGSFSNTLRNIEKYQKGFKEKQVFHFILVPPINIRKPHVSILTFPSTSFSKYNFKGRVSIYYGLLKANFLDVLDPKIFQYLKQLFFFKKNNISLTPGSFVDFERYQSVVFAEKKNLLVFMGLLSIEKQADSFLRSLPDLLESLRSQGISNIEVRILGRESDDFNPDEILSKLQQEALNVEIGFSSNPHQVLREAKVIYSLQRSNNYPSKALLEGIACGTLPVLTDVGTSEMIVPKPYQGYVRGDFESSDLISATSYILSLSQEEFTECQQELFSFIKEQFSKDNSLSYFYDLYKNA